ncbi:MAG TPA: nitrogen fixation protein FixH [Gammaproteobacteria bacterium]|nr:nitrogen fixation protein FixH [Gammaproteobacteria bacterium]
MAISNTFSTLRKRYSQDNPEAMRNPWILGGLGLVATFLTVNAVFIYFAITTSPGLVTEDYYDRGRDYEENVLKIMAAQDALNWETKLAIPAKITIQEPDTYRFSAVDSRGIPIMDADVSVVAYRPSDADADFKVALNQAAPGQYQARIAFPLPGIWDLNITVNDGENTFTMSHRVSAQLP